MRTISRTAPDLRSDPLLQGAAACVLAACVLTAATSWSIVDDLSTDEASTFFVAMRPIGEVLTLPVSFHAQPPLYYLALHEWLRVSDSEPWLRLMSLVCMLGAAATLLRTSWLTPPARLVALGVLLLSDYGLFMGSFIRPYPLAVWLSLWSTLLFCSRLLAATRSWRAHAAYVVVTALMTYSLAMDAWLFAAQGVCVLVAIVVTWRKAGAAAAAHRHGPLFLSVAVVGFVYLPYVIAAARLHASLGHPSLSASLGAAFNPRFFVSGPLYLLAMPFHLGLVAAALAAYAVWTGARRHDPLVVVLLAILAIQIASTHGFLEGRSDFGFRYLAPAYPAACLLVGIGAARALEALHLGRQVVAAAAVCVLAVAALAAALGPGPPVGIWHQLRGDLDAFPGAKIVFFDIGWDAQPLAYEARDDRDVRVMNNPGTGWGTGGQEMTPDYVSAAIARDAGGRATYFYHVDSPAAGRAYHDAFLPAMAARGCARAYRRAMPDFVGGVLVGYVCNGR